ncbi:hypothetical protein GCM10011396_51040 [Undibacterium terreum]|uniref:Methylamine utilization protein n=2 Tax=Undibacterium terreum TaxID=1224302 RepID=A0A916V0V8_9BURK|nr:hypothetical protein GCM10011396_51040 [Undibacterium terreum]
MHTAVVILLNGMVASSAFATLTVQVVDSAGQPVADAVVYAEGTAPLVKSPPQVDVEQKDKKFIPLVTVVQTGTAISFPNNDTVRHHAYSFSAPKPFDIKLYAGTPTKPILFDKPGTVVVGCNIHDQMIAYIQVVDTPYFAKTDASGRARINSITAGKYALKTWHFKQAAGIPVNEQSISYKDDATITVKLNYKAS